MFLFEGPEVKRVSFEKRAKMLSEGKNRDIFIEEWVRSTNYIMDLMESGKLNEGLYNDAMGWLSVQPMHFLKQGASAVADVFPKIASVLKRIGDHPATKISAQVAVLGGLAALFFSGDASATELAGDVADAAVGAADVVAAGAKDYGPALRQIVANPELVGDPDLVSTIKSMLSFAGPGEPVTQELIQDYDRGELVSKMTKALQKIAAAAEAQPEVEPGWADRIKGQLDAVGSKIQSAVGGGEADIAPDISGPEMPEDWSIKGTVATGPDGKTYDLQSQKGLRQYQQATINIDPAEKEKFMKGMQQITKDKR